MTSILRRWRRCRRWLDRQVCRWHGHDYRRRYEPGWPPVDSCLRCGLTVPVPKPNCRCALTPTID